MSNLIRLDQHPLADANWRSRCRKELNHNGVLVLHKFLKPKVLQTIIDDGNALHPLAYRADSRHNVYLLEPDDAYNDDHPRNREIPSTKSCITHDQLPADSPLRQLHNDTLFKSFLCDVLGEANLYSFADPYSSITFHYAAEGQELGWHFDNASFAITFLVQRPRAGGEFQFVRDLRNSETGMTDYDGVGAVLDDRHPVDTLNIEEGDLVLFRGRDFLHRVTPTRGDVTRMIAVLAYNTRPGVALTESARMTFYGKL
nr:PREDICTED: uncharacterized protein LOC109042861 [Bemisia tabaci]